MRPAPTKGIEEIDVIRTLAPGCGASIILPLPMKMPKLADR